MTPDDLPESTPKPHAVPKLPITEDTLVQHVTALDARVSVLEESKGAVVKSVKAILATWLVDTRDEWKSAVASVRSDFESIATMTRNQDKVLTRIDGAVWLTSRILIPALAAVWAIYTFWYSKQGK